MNFICNAISSLFFVKTNKLVIIFVKYILPVHFSTVVACYSFYLIKKYFFSINKTTNQIENDVKNYIPYEEKYNQNFDNLKSNYTFNISHEKFKQKINSLKEKYKCDLYLLEAKYQSFYNNNYDDSDDDSDDDNDDVESTKSILNQINNLKLLLKSELLIHNKAKEECLFDVKSKIMNSLQNNFILENTPNGNVIMVYNNNKNGFSYYSDKSINNKYLESVCKKYCILFECIFLFNNVFIKEGKLSNFNFLKNEIKNKNRKNVNLSFRSFKEQNSLF